MDRDPAVAMLQELSEADGEVRREAFRAILAGQPVSLRALAERTGMAEERIAASIRVQADRGNVRLNERGLVVGAGGVSLEPSRHRLRLGGMRLHTWCAVDAVGIPAALDAHALVETTCAYCGRAIRIELRGDRPTTDPGFVAWLPSKSFKSVADEMCPEMNLFCDRRHLQAWRGETGGPRGRMLRLREVKELGRTWWAGMVEDAQDGEEHPCC